MSCGERGVVSSSEKIWENEFVSACRALDVLPNKIENFR